MKEIVNNYALAEICMSVALTYVCVLSFLLIPRVLKVFLSRTAQRIPYMTSWRVLRLLAVILLVVVWFLVAWTSAVCQNHDTHHALIDIGVTPEGLQFSMCLLDTWDYMMATGKFSYLFCLNQLLWCQSQLHVCLLHLCYQQQPQTREHEERIANSHGYRCNFDRRDVWPHNI